MKRILGTATVALLAATALAGCGSEPMKTDAVGQDSSSIPEVIVTPQSTTPEQGPTQASRTQDPFDETNTFDKVDVPLDGKKTLKIGKGRAIEVVSENGTRVEVVTSGRDGIATVKGVEPGQARISVSVDNGPWTVYALTVR